MCIMTNEELKKVQRAQLELAKIVKRICDENNINYFMIAGTLLGAVRHKGFIPWDDDLDVGMLRKDYEKFISICKDYLSPQVILQTWDNEKEYPLPFAKLRWKDTLYVERNSRNINMNKGIYIDIFVFDNVPEKKFDRIKQKYMSLYYFKVLFAKCGGTPWSEKQKFKKLCYGFIKIWSKLFTYDFLHKHMTKCMTKYNNTPSDKIVAIGGAYGYDRETIQRKWIEEVHDVDFEESTLSAPVLYDEYLSYFYGDYMTPPPENKRGNRHLIVELNFGSLNDINIDEVVK